MRALLLVAVVALVACEGPMGPPGPRGETGQVGAGGHPGERGPKGDDGLGLVDVTTCSLTVGTRPDYVFTHIIYEFADGTVFTSCEAQARAQLNQPTGVAWYRADDPRTATSPCVANSDLDPGSLGHWDFTWTGGASIATYVDPPSTSNGLTRTLFCF